MSRVDAPPPPSQCLVFVSLCFASEGGRGESWGLSRGMWVVGLMEFTRDAVAKGDPHGYADRKCAP